jgi:hypothetical protein
MKVGSNYSYIGVGLFDRKLELSCVKELHGFHIPKLEIIDLHRSEIVNGLIYQRKLIAQYVKQFMRPFPNPWVILSVDDRLSTETESLDTQINFHFFLFIIEAQLNCLFFTTHERALNAVQSKNALITDESAQRAIGIYLLGKEYDEKNG